MQHKTQKVHFIAIGGSVMHNLAIALSQQGFIVSGSDDEIYEPSRTALTNQGIMPQATGWDPARITPDLDAVILGMHALEDNPELLKAQELGLKIYSFPEYINEQARNKQRIVIAGSHGKTTITAMILHVLKFHNREFDYVVGAQLEGFDTAVKLSSAPIIIIEGDEYLSSKLNKTPKFLVYDHHIGLVSGISWDHINAFPTFDEYAKQFDLFADVTPKAGALVYCEEDSLTQVICGKERPDVVRLEYKTHPYTIENGTTYLTTENGKVPLHIFGRHNMQNLAGALTVCKRIGITAEKFYEAIASFKGASLRLERLNSNDKRSVYRDYAHAPSKVTATVDALKEKYADRKLVTALELHTFSSLNKEFIGQYSGSLDKADVAVVYYNPSTLAHKQMEAITEEELRKAFERTDLKLFTDSAELAAFLVQQASDNMSLVLMSSGNFNNLDMQALAQRF